MYNKKTLKKSLTIALFELSSTGQLHNHRLAPEANAEFGLLELRRAVLHLGRGVYPMSYMKLLVAFFGYKIDTKDTFDLFKCVESNFRTLPVNIQSLIKDWMAGKGDLIFLLEEWDRIVPEAIKENYRAIDEANYGDETEF